MIAWMLSAPSRVCLVVALLALGSFSGCASFGTEHARRKMPHPGVVDCDQPRELQMVSQPPYIIEPPDELELSIRPTLADLGLTTFKVRADGNLDLGFAGDVYVAGLTLDQAEQKIAIHLNQSAAARKAPADYQVAIRLVNGTQSKFYYVLGTVTTQGRFPVTGNETVLDAILTAGLRTNSFPEKSYLVRPHPAGGPDQILRIDWVGIKERGDTLTNYQVFPGDRIIVPGGPAPGLLSTLLGG